MPRELSSALLRAASVGQSRVTASRVDEAIGSVSRLP